MRTEMILGFGVNVRIEGHLKITTPEEAGGFMGGMAKVINDSGLSIIGAYGEHDEETQQLVYFTFFFATLEDADQAQDALEGAIRLLEGKQ